MDKPDKIEQVTITESDLDELARLAGYDGEKPLGVHKKLLEVQASKGQDVCEQMLRGYVWGINFLKEHPKKFSQMDIVNALRTNNLEGSALPALGQLLLRTNNPIPGAPVQNRVEVFVDALFAFATK